ncbi:electroneutral sodium bicarbonate exchanger 1-like [Morphnus guianensis]
MPAKHQPDFIYLRHVPLRKVHFFTAIQLICLVLLWTIKVSRAAIIFPLMVLALVFVRKAMDLCFSKRELSFLDDLMPERKKLDDGRNEAGEEEEVRLAGSSGLDISLGLQAEGVKRVPVMRLPSITHLQQKLSRHHADHPKQEPPPVPSGNGGGCCYLAGA